METLLASRLTTTKRVSSEVRAIVVERVGAASAFFGAIKGISTAAIAMASVARPQNKASKFRDTEICEYFMNIPSGVCSRLNPDQMCAHRQVFILHAEWIVRNPGSPYNDVREVPDRNSLQ
jgi:hypothetical protein